MKRYFVYDGLHLTYYDAAFEDDTEEGANDTNGSNGSNGANGTKRPEPLGEITVDEVNRFIESSQVKFLALMQ